MPSMLSAAAVPAGSKYGSVRKGDGHGGKLRIGDTRGRNRGRDRDRDGGGKDDRVWLSPAGSGKDDRDGRSPTSSVTPSTPKSCPDSDAEEGETVQGPGKEQDTVEEDEEDEEASGSSMDDEKHRSGVRSENDSSSSPAGLDGVSPRALPEEPSKKKTTEAETIVVPLRKDSDEKQKGGGARQAYYSSVGGVSSAEKAFISKTLSGVSAVASSASPPKTKKSSDGQEFFCSSNKHSAAISHSRVTAAFDGQTGGDAEAKKKSLTEHQHCRSPMSKEEGDAVSGHGTKIRKNRALCMDLEGGDFHLEDRVSSPSPSPATIIAKKMRPSSLPSTDYKSVNEGEVDSSGAVGRDEIGSTTAASDRGEKRLSGKSEEAGLASPKNKGLGEGRSMENRKKKSAGGNKESRKAQRERSSVADERDRKMSVDETGAFTSPDKRRSPVPPTSSLSPDGAKVRREESKLSYVLPSSSFRKEKMREEKSKRSTSRATSGYVESDGPGSRSLSLPPRKNPGKSKGKGRTDGSNAGATAVTTANRDTSIGRQENGEEYPEPEKEEPDAGVKTSQKKKKKKEREPLAGDREEDGIERISADQLNHHHNHHRHHHRGSPSNIDGASSNVISSPSKAITPKKKKRRDSGGLLSAIENGGNVGRGGGGGGSGGGYTTLDEEEKKAFASPSKAKTKTSAKYKKKKKVIPDWGESESDDDGNINGADSLSGSSRSMAKGKKIPLVNRSMVGGGGSRRFDRDDYDDLDVFQAKKKKKRRVDDTDDASLRVSTFSNPRTSATTDNIGTPWHHHHNHHLPNGLSNAASPKSARKHSGGVNEEAEGVSKDTAEKKKGAAPVAGVGGEKEIELTAEEAELLKGLRKYLREKHVR